MRRKRAARNPEKKYWRAVPTRERRKGPSAARKNGDAVAPPHRGEHTLRPTSRIVCAENSWFQLPLHSGVPNECGQLAPSSRFLAGRGPVDRPDRVPSGLLVRSQRQQPALLSVGQKVVERPKPVGTLVEPWMAALDGLFDH